MESRRNGRKWTPTWVRCAAVMMAVVMLMMPCLAMGEESMKYAQTDGECPVYALPVEGQDAAQTLPAGTTVQVVTELAMGEIQWALVLLEDGTNGYVRSESLKPAEAQAAPENPIPEQPAEEIPNEADGLERAASAAEREERLAAFQTVGNTVTFGSYEQDNNTENGPEAIEWIVLDVQEGKSLLLSRYGLEMKAYNDAFVSVTWENSPLRGWLNTTFIDTAFSGEERAAILTTDVDNSIEQGLSAYALPGNNTQDQIFLLSYHEVFGTYFHDDVSRKCAATAHVISQEGWIASSDETDGAEACWWWTRSPGIQNNAADVGRDGKRYFVNVDIASGCVRPALWIDLGASF